ncbi:hypothetical protein DVU_0369 [Nitratidesulfovibrio vulgaris str. Hildenborough]|uniref:Uncharacterized protein n=1 Tax=Nitratidesulfovibrio vulgaris (strain ATCC 29579 / DSM 644 / CCUG 34227 / NCIMB 8303 / VKM B-1760 / Hildenborough) TaxID=882 RepID=Q72F46_NITV2|nr:hypothetical protein DVU_0369 [Nitratidesulfovibrio vulgaris str. Hildenborough]
MEWFLCCIGNIDTFFCDFFIEYVAACAVCHYT